MIEIRKIYKKDIPSLMEEQSFWNHEFLSISKHRLYAHYKNPNSDADDIVLLLSYLNQELVGYMGIFIDKIVLDGKNDKIGWLSTWWVHPKTKGTGIGREILNTMYDANGGKIGISQFTPSAKRVYDKSGYFYTLKENQGVKAVLRSNLSFVLPTIYPSTKSLLPLWKAMDTGLNVFVNIKLSLQKQSVQSRLKGISLEYLNTIDTETQQLINRHNKGHISPKNNDFFEWLKAYHWVQEAPLLSMTNKAKYEFSMCDQSFNIYFIKIIRNHHCIGFVALQKRNFVSKLLFAYYDDSKYAAIVSDVIKLQAMEQNTREIICYDPSIRDNFKKSGVFLYKTNKLKQSIISKVYNKSDFNDVVMNFGDGDCSFA